MKFYKCGIRQLLDSPCFSAKMNGNKKQSHREVGLCITYDYSVSMGMPSGVAR